MFKNRKLSVYDDVFPDNWKELLKYKIKKDKIKYELKPEAMTNYSNVENVVHDKLIMKFKQDLRMNL